jgi:hypothetical protein
MAESQPDPATPNEQGAPIRARFLWTFREYLDSSETYGRTQCRPVLRVAVGIVCVVMIGVGFMGLASNEPWALPKALAMIAVGSYLLFFRRHDVRWTLGRQFRRRPDRDTEVVFLLSEESVSNASSVGEGNTPWSAFVKVRKGDRGYLLFPIDSIYYWLPFHAFGSVDDLVRADELIRRKVADSASVR